MIASSSFSKGTAFALAFAGHSALALYFFQVDAVQIEGSAGGATARLGNSFADMAASSYSPQQPDTVEQTDPVEAPVTEPVEADAVKAPSPDTVQPTETSESTKQANAAPAETALPTAADSVAPSETTASQAATAAAAAPPTEVATPETQNNPLTAQATSQAVLNVNVSETPPKPAETLQSVAPSVTTAVAATKPISAAKPVTASSAVKAAPAAKPVQPKVTAETVKAIEEPEQKPEPVKKAEKKPEPKKAQPPKKTAKKAPPPSQASQSARAGKADGKEDSKTVSAGKGGKSNSAGNAKASNYPGLVMRKIARARKPNVRSRGVAIVSFRIAASGALASVSLAGKSGSAALDSAALQVVRKAAPFPKPPAGAQRSFSVRITGK